MVSMAGTRSHSHFYGELARVLAERGHEITLVTGFELPYHPKIRQIVVDGDLVKLQNSSLDIGDKTKLFKIMNRVREQCIENLEHPDIKNLDLKSFDLILNGALCSDCFLYKLEEVQVPIISYWPNTLTSVLHAVMGSIEFPSVTPDVWFGITYPMGFTQRAGNIAAGLFSLALNKHYVYPHMERRLCEEGRWCPEGGKSLFDINKQSALLFINTIEALQVPARPLPPNVIAVGGLNCHRPRPLPADLKSWADESTDGFIYFSLGSAVKISDIEEETVQNIMESFKKMKLNVIWKSNINSPDNTPSNVRMQKWLPQQDLLGHPNCRLFISHGGLFSVTEATYHGVPMLLIPAYGDQPTNAARVVAEGWGLSMDLHAITEDAFTSNVIRLLEEDSYRNVARKRSALMQDQPLSPRELVVYWTEYVIRRGGAPHLRSPFHDMYWFQIYNVDVWLFVLGNILVVVTVSLLVLKFIVKFGISFCLPAAM